MAPKAAIGTKAHNIIGEANKVPIEANKVHNPNANLSHDPTSVNNSFPRPVNPWISSLRSLVGVITLFIIIPFIAIQIFAMALLVLWPELATWLPNLIYGS